MLLVAEGTLWHSDGFKAVAATPHESAQNARVDGEQSGAWFLSSPTGTCGCHGDDFMAEGSDALLDRLDRVMRDELDAKMLGRVGCGQLTEVKVLKRTVRWHE